MDELDAGSGGKVSITGGAGDDVLISRDGNDTLDGGEDCDLYVVYPTHDREHHREAGCTQIFHPGDGETIEFRNADESCVY